MHFVLQVPLELSKIYANNKELELENMSYHY